MIIERIAKDTGLDSLYIGKTIRSANHLYKTYTIPKKKRGRREISQPAAKLKLLQRWLVKNIFVHFPVHDSVYSYRIGRSIKDLASKHKNNNYLLRIDFSNFFPSIKYHDVINFLNKHSDLVPFPLSKADREIISTTICKNGALSVGAPSSPAISNIILYDFDKFLYELAKRNKAVYSRYADDIYLSCNRPGVLSNVYEDIMKSLKHLKSPKLEINDKKTVFTSKKHKRMVTGLVLSSERQVSIGRSKKRLIKSMVFRFTQADLSEKQISFLRGYLSYIKSVEPIFLANLCRKFGKETISSIFAAKTITTKKQSRRV